MVVVIDEAQLSKIVFYYLLIWLVTIREKSWRREKLRGEIQWKRDINFMVGEISWRREKFEVKETIKKIRKNNREISHWKWVEFCSFTGYIIKFPLGITWMDSTCNALPSLGRLIQHVCTSQFIIIMILLTQDLYYTNFCLEEIGKLWLINYTTFTTIIIKDNLKYQFENFQPIYWYKCFGIDVVICYIHINFNDSFITIWHIFEGVYQHP